MIKAHEKPSMQAQDEVGDGDGKSVRRCLTGRQPKDQGPKVPGHSSPGYVVSMPGACRQTTMLSDPVQPQIMEAIFIMYRGRHMQQTTLCTRRRARGNS